jgi:hypothetical protein
MKKIKINRNIYSDRTIKAAIQAYKHHAMISANFKNEYAILTFLKCKYDEELTIREFENYMIGIENS